jgi:hypothetical protein
MIRFFLKIVIFYITVNTHLFGQANFSNDISTYEKSSFNNTLTGGLAGAVLGIVIYRSDERPHGFTGMAPVLLPTLGAVISFNLTAKPK